MTYNIAEDIKREIVILIKKFGEKQKTLLTANAEPFEIAKDISGIESVKKTLLTIVEDINQQQD